MSDSENIHSTPTPRLSSGSRVTALLTFTAFLVFVCYISFRTESFQPSIELRNLASANLYYLADGFLLQDSLETYQLGPMQARPFLYELLMGKALNLRIAGFSNQVMLRLFNIGLAALFFMASILLIKTFSRRQAVQTVFLILISIWSWPVLSFAAVTAQNLSMLLTVLFLTYFLRFHATRRVNDLLALLIFLSIATLTQAHFVMLFFSAVAAILLLAFKRSPLSSRSSFNLLTFALIPLLLSMLCANAYYYGNNLFKYGTITPSADDIMGFDVAYKYVPDFRRTYDRITAARGAGAISLEGYFNSFTEDLLNQLLGSHSEGAPPVLFNDVVLFSLLLCPVIFGLLSAFINLFRKNIFKNAAREKNRLVAPLFLLLLVYLAACVTQSFFDYSQKHFIDLPIDDARYFPLFLIVLLFISHFGVAHFSRLSLKILGGVIIVTLFGVPQLQKLILHVRYNNKSVALSQTENPPNLDPTKK